MVIIQPEGDFVFLPEFELKEVSLKVNNLPLLSLCEKLWYVYVCVRACSTSILPFWPCKWASSLYSNSILMILYPKFSHQYTKLVFFLVWYAYACVFPLFLNFPFPLLMSEVPLGICLPHSYEPPSIETSRSALSKSVQFSLRVFSAPLCPCWPICSLVFLCFLLHSHHPPSISFPFPFSELLFLWT